MISCSKEEENPYANLPYQPGQFLNKTIVLTDSNGKVFDSFVLTRLVKDNSRYELHEKDDYYSYSFSVSEKGIDLYHYYYSPGDIWYHSEKRFFYEKENIILFCSNLDNGTDEFISVTMTIK
jgi:PKD repeat protein